MVPERMRNVERWNLSGTELWVDDAIGDGQLTSTGKGFPLMALFGHAAGVLHAVNWQGPAGAWTATERMQIKTMLTECLANRLGFGLGRMRFRPHVATDPSSGKPMVYVYRTDVRPEVIVAVSGAAGLVLTPDHRYLDVAVLDHATEACLAERSTPRPASLTGRD